MSKLMMVVCGLMLLVASVALAAEPYEIDNTGGAVAYNARSYPYGRGVTPAGMRFGDIGHTGAVQVSEDGSGAPGTCPNCGFGIAGVPCDPCWRGPCMDWKLIGWYSYFHGGGSDGAACGSCGKCGNCCNSCRKRPKKESYVKRCWGAPPCVNGGFTYDGSYGSGAPCESCMQ